MFVLWTDWSCCPFISSLRLCAVFAMTCCLFLSTGMECRHFYNGLLMWFLNVIIHLLQLVLLLILIDVETFLPQALKLCCLRQKKNFQGFHQAICKTKMSFKVVCVRDLRLNTNFSFKDYLSQATGFFFKLVCISYSF